MIDTTFVVHAKHDGDFRTEVEHTRESGTVDRNESYALRFKSGDFWLTVSVNPNQFLDFYEQMTKEITNAN